MFRFAARIWEEFKEYIILIILLLASLILISLNQNPSVKKVRAVAFGSFAAFTSIISDLTNRAQLEAENERLRNVNAELMLQVNRLREYGILNKELKALLTLKDSSDYPLIPARVVSKSLSKSQSVVTINLGTNDSIRPGMPVINDLGLVGIVHSTSEDFSIVRTLKNLDLKLTVKDERSRVDGIMKWNGSDLVIVNVPKTYDIEKGDRIITSDLSSLVSLPLQVGLVHELSNIETGIFNEVKIKPFVDFAKVENVFVIKIIQSRQKNNLELNFYNVN